VTNFITHSLLVRRRRPLIGSRGNMADCETLFDACASYTTDSIIYYLWLYIL